MKLDLFLLAGEPSGDLHGEQLFSALKTLCPNLLIGGVGGPKMRARGMHCFLPMEEFEVMGFFDMVPSLPKLIGHFRKVKRYLLNSPPKAVVLIDYPGFNLRLARALKKKKSPSKTIQYVCPSVWAWGKWRVPLMRRYLDKLLALLPFEQDIFHGKLSTDYIGHPVVERIANYSYDSNWRHAYGIAPKVPLFALFPGSREKEVVRNFPLQARIAHQLIREFPLLCLVVSCSSPKLLPLIQSHLPKQAYVIDERHCYELMRNAQVAIATSGTVTLERALHQVPTVVTYAIRSVEALLAYHILRIRLPYYALPNLIAQKEIFPELFGPNLTAANLTSCARNYLISACNREACIKECLTLKSLLGAQQASLTAAQAILAMIQS
jgi:lipid-A-disaccharide synthase